MLFPTCGKVVIVDDQVEEAKPLIKLLSKRGVPTLYFSGDCSDLPESPLRGVRLVFCDLKFSAASDERTILSNLIGILRKLISNNNGPYILLLWSAHDGDYIERIKEIVSAETNSPEFVLPLNKAEFFESDDKISRAISNVIADVEALGLADDGGKIIQSIEDNLGQFGYVTQKPVSDAVDLISEKLESELKKAGLFHLFVIWENTMGGSALQTVNAMHSEIPESIPKDKKLRAMLFYLAHARLEQRFDEASPELKFSSAIESLNELFSYFQMENIHNLKSTDFEIDKILHLEGVADISCAKFNRWKMFLNVPLDRRPGNVFYDDDKTFELYDSLHPKKIKSANTTYDALASLILSDPQIIFVLVDLSSECDIAQKKIFSSRVVPGIIIPEGKYNELIESNTLKESDCIFVSPVVEFEDKNWRIIVNTNQLFFMDGDKLYGKTRAFTFTEPYVIDLKQKSARNISKHGIEKFGK